MDSKREFIRLSISVSFCSQSFLAAKNRAWNCEYDQINMREIILALKFNVGKCYEVALMARQALITAHQPSYERRHNQE